MYKRCISEEVYLKYRDKFGGKMTETITTDKQEEILVELTQLKDCLSLYSKLTVANGETISPEEMNAFFNSLKMQVEGIVKKVEVTLH